MQVWHFSVEIHGRLMKFAWSEVIQQDWIWSKATPFQIEIPENPVVIFNLITEEPQWTEAEITAHETYFFHFML